jgi:nucleoside-diphosphate-sugar epimerase
MKMLFCFGLGYSAKTLGRRLLAEDWRVAGTARSAEASAKAGQEGFECVLFDGQSRSVEAAELVSEASHILVSIPPGEEGDAALGLHGDDLAGSQNLKWIGYLSTVGVYGDWAGEWVDETSEPRPIGPRSQKRLAAEGAWLAFGETHALAAHVFRLPGIYGPGRNALATLKSGRARRVIKPGQVFNRVHVADIASALALSMAQPRAGAIYNVCDDEPAPPQDVIAYAAELLGVEPPPEIAFEEADLSPMGKSFYGECKRVSNALIKTEFDFTPEFPNYREGLKALCETEGA